jgi:hypothetical protein
VLPASSDSSIQSLLILPIQRIPRYVLLLEDLLKHTPDESIDKPDLITALDKMKKVPITCQGGTDTGVDSSAHQRSESKS